jgi:four helix bundle protein
VGLRPKEVGRRNAEVGKRDAELRTQLQIAYEIRYVDNDLFHSLDDRYERLAKMIGALIKARRR